MPIPGLPACVPECGGTKGQAISAPERNSNGKMAVWPWRGRRLLKFWAQSAIGGPPRIVLSPTRMPRPSSPSAAFRVRGKLQGPDEFAQSTRGNWLFDAHARDRPKPGADDPRHRVRERSFWGMNRNACPPPPFRLRCSEMSTCSLTSFGMGSRSFSFFPSKRRRYLEIFLRPRYSA